MTAGVVAVSPVAQRVRELLADGEWHDLEEVIVEAGKAIPPGVAIRALETARRSSQRHRGLEVTPRVMELSSERQVASGRRRLVNRYLGGGGRHRAYEISPPATGGNRRVLGRKIRLAR